MTIRNILVGTAVSATLFATMAAPAFALPKGPGPQGQNLNASVCNANGSPVVNVTYTVTNDTDSGLHGNWATDNYNKSVQVWDQGDGTFCAIVKYEGQFITTGPNSPQEGVPLDSGIQGTFEGGYQATFRGILDPGTNVTNGYLGTFDLRTEVFDWLIEYFPTNSGFDQPYWSWTYHGGNNGTWVNALSGNSGDITGD